MLASHGLCSWARSWPTVRRTEDSGGSCGWLQSMPAQASSSSQTKEHGFVIGNDDVLEINVWKEPDLSLTTPVRPDGKISLPLLR